MNAQKLTDTARALVAGDKGLLAIDESTPTCNKRFAGLGIPQTEEARRAYRELIVTTPGLGESISGLILYDETIRQEKKDGTPFVRVIEDAGIIPGIKVDAGARGWPLIRERGSPKVWTDCATAWRNTPEWAPDLPSGARCWPSATAFPAGVASRPTHRRWLAMPHCARKPDWSPSSSRNCSWTASIPWSVAAS